MMQAEIAYQPLSPFQAPKWRTMTFPRYRPLLHTAGMDIVAIGAQCHGAPVGLIIGRLGEAELLSVYVLREFRGRGIGEKLVEQLENALAERGCESVRAVWMSGTPGADAFARLLVKRNWVPAQRRMVVFKATFAKLGKAAWFDAFADVADGLSIVPWAALSTQQLSILRQTARFERWIPADLNPFDFAGAGIDGSPPEPRLSLACVQWDEVVGWSLAHRVDAATARISCTYVHPDLQARLLMLALWRETLMRQKSTEYTNVSWAIACTRAQMIEFNDRFMTPYIDSRTETWGSRKLLT